MQQGHTACPAHAQEYRIDAVACHLLLCLGIWSCGCLVLRIRTSFLKNTYFALCSAQGEGTDLQGSFQQVQLRLQTLVFKSLLV